MTLVSPPYQLTAQDLLSMPDNNTMEFVDGQIVEKNVSFLSSRVASQINGVFGAFVGKSPVAAICGPDMGYQCFQAIVDKPDLMRKPDVSVIRIERVRKLKNPNPGYMPIPPDLAVEVISTNDTMRDVIEKLREYRLGGFPLVWVVEPIERTITVHPNPGKPVILTADDQIDAPHALPGFSCKVADLFPTE